MSTLHFTVLRDIDSSRIAGNELIGDIKCVVSELVIQVSNLSQALENLTALCSNGSCNASFSLMSGVNVNYSDVSAKITLLRFCLRDYTIKCNFSPYRLEM